MFFWKFGFRWIIVDVNFLTWYSAAWCIIMVHFRDPLRRLSDDTLMGPHFQNISFETRFEGICGSINVFQSTRWWDRTSRILHLSLDLKVFERSAAPSTSFSRHVDGTALPKWRWRDLTSTLMGPYFYVEGASLPKKYSKRSRLIGGCCQLESRKK